MARLILRDWQVRCVETFVEKMRTALAGDTQLMFRVEACVGSGKTTVMADIAHRTLVGDLLDEFRIDLAIFVAPSTAIVGWRSGRNREAAGIIGALERRGFWPMESITAGNDRMPGLMARPEMKQTDAGIVGATAAFTYQYLIQTRVQDTIVAWAEQGLRIAIFLDEIHHVPEGPTAWANALRRVTEKAVLVASFSGTWFRSDEAEIYTGAGADFRYLYVDGIRDGIVRPLSFWIENARATIKKQGLGGFTVVDDRPVSEYLEGLPPEVRRELFNPNGDFVERMIVRADKELARRRLKYADAGCLFVCPPGFYGVDGASNEEQDRVAKVIAARVEDLTGERPTLVLNGDPDSLIAEYRESNAKFIVGVNRITEGCDIPRLRMAALLREIKSELLFTQIAGRIIRRRDGEDAEPGLLLLPPIYGMAEWARQITVAKAGAAPKPLTVCEHCGRVPCKCPCKRCGQPKPCKCPCPICGHRPCICPDVPLDTFVELQEEKESHIIHGTDIEDRHANRAERIIEKVAACHHRDRADMAFIFQVDEEVNGIATQAAGRSHATPTIAAIKSAANWGNLRDSVAIRARKLALAHSQFRNEKNQFGAVFAHLSRRFFPGQKWSVISKDPAKMSVEKLTEILRYIERLIGGGSV